MSFGKFSKRIASETIHDKNSHVSIAETRLSDHAHQAIHPRHSPTPFNPLPHSRNRAKPINPRERSRNKRRKNNSQARRIRDVGQAGPIIKRGHIEATFHSIQRDLAYPCSIGRKRADPRESRSREGEYQSATAR